MEKALAVASAEANARVAEVTDEAIQVQHDAYGRLGYYPRSFDLRAAWGVRSNFYLADSRFATKAITLVGEPAHEIIVHELVHALQDQHFDLTAFSGEDLTTDESLARATLIEGDARIAQLRDYYGDRKYPVISSLQGYVDLGYARELANNVLADASVPRVVGARSSFAYGYGALFVAATIGVPQGRYDLDLVNALFAPGHAPSSTEAMMRVGMGEAPEPFRSPGLAELPASVAQDWSTDFEDRLGRWYSYLLFYDQGGALPSSDGLSRPYVDAETLAHHWDGDQLLLLRKKDRSATAIAWTSTWDDESAAATVVDALTRVQGATIPDDAEPRALVAADGEPVWIERSGADVVLVKNLEAALAADVAASALGSGPQRRHVARARPLRVLQRRGH